MSLTRVNPTIELAAAPSTRWEVVVIGAGPAGSLAALELARGGSRVLLVDRAEFPRWKVCGCCLSERARRSLTEAGLGDLLGVLGARRIDRVSVRSGGEAVVAPLAPTRIVSREGLDAALARRAIAAGAAFLPRTRAKVLPDSRIALACGNESVEVNARTILLASGLHDAAARHTARRRAWLSRESHVGLGATGDADAAPDLPRHLTMAIGARGYVGFVHLEDGRLNAAAAVSPTLLKAAGSPAQAIARILDDAGVEGVDPHRLDWRGTPPLTRTRSRVQQGSFFAIGDAARFVEPVTGEGMSWALAAGRAVVPHVLARARGDAQETWPAAHRRLLRARHARCALVSRAMRHPLIMSMFMRTMDAVPVVRERALRTLIGAPAGAVEPAE
jgi:flavin-dependent dehydrogenase